VRLYLKKPITKIKTKQNKTKNHHQQQQQNHHRKGLVEWLKV
jgi:hypothetical protein